MSVIPPSNTNFKQEVYRYVKILNKLYPCHGTRKELTWLYASWELQVTEMSVRNYIKQKKLKNLMIPTIAEFIVLQEIKEQALTEKKK